MPLDVQSARTVAILGGSISAGLGVAGQSYVDLLPALTHGTIITRNYSNSGQSIVDSLDRLPEVIAARPDVVVVAHGGFDAVVRPTDASGKWIPKRWRSKGWLDPRPYFSPKLLKGTYQRIESAVRWRYRILLLHRFGGAPWIPPAQFSTSLQQMVDRILTQTDAKILLLTPMGINGHYYPGTPQSMERCIEIMRCVSHKHADSSRVKLVDVSTLLDRQQDFFADGFHPNARGHRKIAEHLVSYLDSRRRV